MRWGTPYTKGHTILNAECEISITKIIIFKLFFKKKTEQEHIEEKHQRREAPEKHHHHLGYHKNT